METMKPASRGQQKMFFALGNAIKKDSEKLKESAKKHFKVEHFNELTSDQLTYLIDRLLKAKDEYEKNNQ